MDGIDEEYVMSALMEIATQTDRGAAIIGAAILENVLTECLQLRFILNKSQRERLFSYEKNGPLANFSAKIDAAFSVGLIPALTRDRLHLSRRVRNRFAHHALPLRFSDKSIAAWCQSLPILDPAIRQPRHRFLLACAESIGLLGLTRQLRDFRIAELSVPDLSAKMDVMATKLLELLKEQENKGIEVGDFVARIPELAGKINIMQTELLELRKKHEAEDTLRSKFPLKE